MSSNNNDEEDYADEYSEGDPDFHDQDGDGVDEQHAQKVNGQLEVLQSSVDSLTAALNAATLKNKSLLESQEHMEKENSKLRDLVVECSTLKRKNKDLKEQLDSALALNGISSEIPSKTGRMNKSGVIPGSALDGGGSQTSLYTADSMYSKRTKSQEGETRKGSIKNQDVQSLRTKVIQMNERIRIEKEYKYKAEADVQAGQRKIDMLSSHMEKLVIHLKHEGAHKLRLAEQLRVSERETTALSEKCDLISRKSSAKDRLILELREGSKVLEDQLRLMDEKYMELRTKLDYARELGVKKIKKAEKVASDLRIKFAMSNGSAILDSIPLPTEDSQWSGFHSAGGDPRGNPMLMYTDSSTPYTRQGGNSPVSRGRSGPPRQVTFPTSSSLTSLGSAAQREPTMDGVLDKIRNHEGRKQEWTEDKLNKLVKRHK